MSKKIAIIGSGPSGLTAAIYTSRAGIDTTVFTGVQPGGQLTNTTEIENFPGAWDEQTKEGMQGPDLMARIQAQAENFGTKVRFGEEIIKIDINKIKDKNQKNFTLTNSFDEKEDFDTVIIATGATAKYLGLENEMDYIGRGYHTCATCDGYFYKDKIIAVVGGGDSAFEEATYLTNHARKVYLINRTDKFKASKIMVERGLNNKKIEVILNSSVTKFLINKENKFVGVKILNNLTSNFTELNIDGLFVAIGHVPNSNIAKDFLTVDDAGYLITRSKLLPSLIASGKTPPSDWAKFGNMSEIEGLFIAGDVEDKIYRQAITSAGDGCRAGMDAERWLEENL